MKREPRIRCFSVLIVLFVTIFIHSTLFAEEPESVAPTLPTVEAEPVAVVPTPIEVETAPVSEPVLSVPDSTEKIETEEQGQEQEQKPSVDSSNQIQPSDTMPSCPHEMTKESKQRCHDVSHYTWLQPPPPAILQAEQMQQHYMAMKRVRQEQAQAFRAWQQLQVFQANQRMYWQQCAGCHGNLPPQAINTLMNAQRSVAPTPPPWVQRPPSAYRGNYQRW